MEEAAAVRRAALAAVDDVEPARLRDRIEDRLDDASVAPGVLTLVSARAVRDGPFDGVTDRAAGVQLIYEGLGLTRSLARSDPWASSDDQASRDDADLDILIADILVSRGFYLLARTEAADAAVGVVRAFGTDQTVRTETGDDSPDRNLEADVLELAVVAGTTAAGGRAPARLREYAADLAADGLPAAGPVAGPDVRDTLTALVGSEPPTSDGVRTSADN